MDELDLKIILELQKDGRESNLELSRKFGTPESTVRRRVQRLINDHVIKVTALPNPSKVGYQMIAFIGLQVELSKLERVADRLVKCPNVHLLCLTTGSFDMIAWALFESTTEFDRFVRSDLAAIPGINRAETMVHVDLRKQSPGWIVPAEGKESKESRNQGIKESEVREGLGLDELDHKIILALQEDGRQNNQEIARQLGISPSTVRRRIEQMVADGVIKISAVPNPWKVGYETMALIGMGVQLDKLDYVARTLARNPDVHYLAVTAGRFDIMVWVQFRSWKELSEFAKVTLASVPGITHTETFIIYSFRKQTFGWVLPTSTSFTEATSPKQRRRSSPRSVATPAKGAKRGRGPTYL